MLSLLVYTLGCKLNQLESEAAADAFCQSGFTLYKHTSGGFPSVIVINTCTVTSKADQKARRVIRKALRNYPASRVLVTGCYASLNREDLLNLEPDSRHRLFVINKENILKLPEYFIKDENKHYNLDHIINTLTTIDKQLPVNPAQEQKDRKDAFQFNPQKFSSHTRSFLKIQDGCNRRCTYCRIRLARGACISLDAEQALSRLRILEQNHGEAVLTGVNISQYHDTSRAESAGVGAGVGEKAFGLAGLLEYLLSGTEKIPLRLSSLEPECIDENLVKVLSHKRIRPHFHLSVQSGSEKILEKMGRAYSGETVKKAAALLRQVKDDPFLACDIITGFPAEGEAEFNETYELCEKTDFAWIHVFPYSKRPGTPAFSFPQTVPEKVITERARLLGGLAKRGKADYARRWHDREVEVLIEKSEHTDKSCRGTSENYLKTLVFYNGGKAPQPGTTLRCKLLETDNNNYDAQARCTGI
jgi:threonylcarbamoyladenosine tRNA methylthiotransferase MtaB